MLLCDIDMPYIVYTFGCVWHYVYNEDIMVRDILLSLNMDIKDWSIMI